MKLIRRNKNLGSLFLAALFLFTSCANKVKKTEEVQNTASLENEADIPLSNSPSSNTIKMALLLDTSNSMDGLIEQAKSQLWKIVNELSNASKNGEPANLLISLYEYGNDNLNESNGYLRQVLPLTSDLDTLSQELFALSTFGGEEYCGEVIADCLNKLEWEAETEGLQVIVIAGNEPFDQGETNYGQSCDKAVKNDVIINTIFCGEENLGITSNWQDGAIRGKGFYGTINMDEKTTYIESPFDEKINALNASLNDTYIPYGRMGNQKYMSMSDEDQNASTYGSANTTERVIVKSKSNVYKNASWDLVDASDEANFDLTKIADSDLPVEMRGLTAADKNSYIQKMKNKRNEIKAQIADLSSQRSAYIEDKKKEMGTNDSFEDAILNAIKKQARAKNFTFDRMT